MPTSAPSPRNALVTGANRGIGLEIVRQLSRAGLTAVIASRDRAKGERAADLLRRDGIIAPVVTLDVANPDSVQQAVADLETRFGRIDVLVNNAAILIDGPGGFDASVFDLTDETLRSTMETNLLGPLRLSRALLPGMMQRGYGRVVNVSSSAGQLAHMSAGFPGYRMSKTALNALTAILAAEVRAKCPRGDIKINAADPGWVRSDMGGPDAERSLTEGAGTPVWLALLPADGPTGGFFRNRRAVAW